MRQVDKALIIAVQRHCGGGHVHAAVQMTAAYQMAVARYNHRNTAEKDRAAIAMEIAALENKLYSMSR